MTSSSSWSILGWISSDPTDLYGSSRCHTSSGYTEGLSWSQSWSFSWRSWDLFRPSSMLEKKAKKELNISALPISLFVRGSLTSCSGLMLFLHYLLLLIHLNHSYYCLPYFCPASTPAELWPHHFSSITASNISLFLSHHLTLLPLHAPSFFALSPKEDCCSAKLAFCLFDFWHFGIACSYALRRQCLKSD